VKDRYDVIVAGAGPAGSVAAKTAAERGLSVLLVEKKQEISEPVS
jgi:digeranylgeranylglycerophospholipid reductase